MSGDFTPGAGLEDWQIAVVVAFLLSGRGRSDEEKLDDLRILFGGAIPPAWKPIIATELSL